MTIQHKKGEEQVVPNGFVKQFREVIIDAGKQVTPYFFTQRKCVILIQGSTRILF